MAAVNLYRMAGSDSGALKIRTLFSFSGESVLPELDAEKTYIRHFKESLQTFFREDTVHYKWKKVEDLTLLESAWHIRSEKTADGFVLVPVRLASLTRKDLEGLLGDDDMLSRIHLELLNHYERQFGRYTIEVDGVKMETLDELHDCLSTAYKGDKKQLVEALFLLLETVCADTTENLYSAAGDPSKGLIVKPLLHAKVSFSTKEFCVTHTADYELDDFRGSRPERITNFRLLHVMSKAMAASRIVHHT